jgi:hypothetical protein
VNQENLQAPFQKRNNVILRYHQAHSEGSVLRLERHDSFDRLHPPRLIFRTAQPDTIDGQPSPHSVPTRPEEDFEGASIVPSHSRYDLFRQMVKFPVKRSGDFLLAHFPITGHSSDCGVLTN